MAASLERASSLVMDPVPVAQIPPNGSRICSLLVGELGGVVPSPRMLGLLCGLSCPGGSHGVGGLLMEDGRQRCVSYCDDGTFLVMKGRGGKTGSGDGEIGGWVSIGDSCDE